MNVKSLHANDMLALKCFDLILFSQTFTGIIAFLSLAYVKIPLNDKNMYLGLELDFSQLLISIFQ